MEIGEPLRRDDRERFCLVVSSPMTAKAFLRDLLRSVAGAFKLRVIANAPNGDFLEEMHLEASFAAVPLRREISPWHDVIALLQLARVFRHGKFQIVHSVTPKAGLLAMTAAWLAGIPCRVHTFTGQVWATRTGWRRRLLKCADRMTAFFATHLLVDSPSQREFLLAERVIRADKSRVLGCGSISGVDVDRFKPDGSARVAVRKELGLSEQDVVFLYVGRLNRDKGVPELLKAFALLVGKFSAARLLLVGPDEEDLDRNMPSSTAMMRVGYTDQPERYMAAADVFVLPSHREGFGSTIIEAAACGLPSIASRIYGLTDAVVEGLTGLLHRPQSVADLASAMEVLAADPEKRDRMGREARARALRDFRMEAVTRHTMQFYRSALAQSGCCR